MFKQLEKDGFILIYDRFYDKSRVYEYEYSDFEILRIVCNEMIGIDGTQRLEIQYLKIYNPMGKADEDSLDDAPDNNIYAKVDYHIYFKSVDEFYTLLKLLGYEIKSRNITIRAGKNILPKTES